MLLVVHDHGVILALRLRLVHRPCTCEQSSKVARAARLTRPPSPDPGHLGREHSGFSCCVGLPADLRGVTTCPGSPGYRTAHLQCQSSKVASIDMNGRFKPGDHLQVRRWSPLPYHHHGIYVSDDRVISSAQESQASAKRRSRLFRSRISSTMPWQRWCDTGGAPCSAATY